MDDFEAFDRAMRLRESDPSEAARLWRDLAERGDLDAAYNLGLLLRERLPTRPRRG
jgi:TPR repeat protein